ncbi:MAG: hypothetical protein IT337_09380 [Thermomicrobiales bacterium]|nr:hypothetical protein [Thermomicrobiales bacterium]
MSLATIVAALRPVIDAVTGIAACYPRIPETQPPVDPFAIIETASGSVIDAGADFDKLTYAVNVYVMTKRNGDLWAEQGVVLPYVNSIPDALRSAFTLGGLTYGTRYGDPAWELVDAEIDNQNYLGVKFALLYKERAVATFSG